MNRQELAKKVNALVQKSQWIKEAPLSWIYRLKSHPELVHKFLSLDTDGPMSLNANEIDGKMHLYMYGPIDVWFGYAAQTFARELPKDQDQDVVVHGNSPGGMVWEALAIMNQLLQRKGNVTYINEGVTASAAIDIMLGATDRLVPKGSTFLVHNAWGGVVGTSKEMRRAADDLDTINDESKEIYPVSYTHLTLPTTPYV